MNMNHFFHFSLILLIIFFPISSSTKCSQWEKDNVAISCGETQVCCKTYDDQHTENIHCNNEQDCIQEIEDAKFIGGGGSYSTTACNIMTCILEFTCSSEPDICCCYTHDIDVNTNYDFEYQECSEIANCQNAGSKCIEHTTYNCYNKKPSSNSSPTKNGLIIGSVILAFLGVIAGILYYRRRNVLKEIEKIRSKDDDCSKTSTHKENYSTIQKPFDKKERGRETRKMSKSNKGRKKKSKSPNRKTENDTNRKTEKDYIIITQG